jgi:hypothetical protein
MIAPVTGTRTAVTKKFTKAPFFITMGILPSHGVYQFVQAGKIALAGDFIPLVFKNS